jgi:hypothetical protein
MHGGDADEVGQARGCGLLFSCVARKMTVQAPSRDGAKDILPVPCGEGFARDNVTSSNGSAREVDEGRCSGSEALGSPMDEIGVMRIESVSDR